MDGKRYRVIFEDEHLMVIDKPAGMLVIETPKREPGTLTNLLNRDLDSRGIETNAHPCHRLDRETSGIIIYAKGKKIQRLVMDEFRKRFVKKLYIAVVQGIVKKNFDTIKKSIYNRNKKRQEDAITKYRVLERKGKISVLEVEPVTGRTNQIRIHLKEIGHPIVGESVYAYRKDYEVRFKRTALHAAFLEFTHPVTRKILKFTSPIPADMVSLIQKGE